VAKWRSGKVAERAASMRGLKNRTLYKRGKGCGTRLIGILLMIGAVALGVRTARRKEVMEKREQFG